MARIPKDTYVIGWLLLLHALAAVALALYRTHDVDRNVVDLLSAALSASQLCLLAIWLAIGRRRGWWRVCGLIGGASFLFIVHSRFVFPGQFDIGPAAVWLDEEWNYYFRPQGPGDLWIKAPLLLLGILPPLLAARIVRRVTDRRRARRSAPVPAAPESTAPAPRLVGMFQFRLSDIVVLAVTVSLAMAVVYRTAPHATWWTELIKRWREAYGLQGDASGYAVVSSSAYVAAALGATYLVFGRGRPIVRLPLGLLLALGPAVACDWWRAHSGLSSSTADDWRLWCSTSSELTTILVATAVMVGSLSLVRLWQQLTDRLAALN